MLSNSKRKEFFKAIGMIYPDDISKLQKKYMYRVTGKYDKETENCLKAAYNCTLHGKGYFTPTEFRCKCGGKYCNGFPDYPKAQLIKDLVYLREDSKASITIRSGLRCKKWNAAQSGSASQSRHMSGKAVDIYSKVLTSTKEARDKLIKRWYSFKGANYAYGNTANMGTSVHLDIK